MGALLRKAHNDNVSAYMLANFHHMFAFEDWWAASKDNFDWGPVEGSADGSAVADDRQEDHAVA